jgi:hypothetical protein
VRAAAGGYGRAQQPGGTPTHKHWTPLSFRVFGPLCRWQLPGRLALVDRRECGARRRLNGLRAAAAASCAFEEGARTRPVEEMAAARVRTEGLSGRQAQVNRAQVK